MGAARTASRSSMPPDPTRMRRLLVVLGIPIDDLTMDEALDRLEAFVEYGRLTGKSHQVATVNADFVVKALADPELRYLLQSADMATADGMPLVWAARLLGVSLAGRVTGADMVPALAGRAAKKGYSLYLLGAGPGIADRAAEILQEQNPQLKIAGVYCPPYSSVLEMDHEVVEQIQKAKPDIVLVAFGNPKQEKWIGMYGRELEVPVMIGVGGTLDFIAGETKRAPGWMQRMGLEWLYRLLQEPRRLWKRYVSDLFGFGTFFLRQWLLMRRQKLPATLLPAAEVLILDQGRQQKKVAVINVTGRLDVNFRESFLENCRKALAVTPHIVVNLANAQFLDSTAVGTLVATAKQAQEAGGELRLAAVPSSIEQTLSLLRLDRFFEIEKSVSAALDQRGQELPEEQLELTGNWAVYRSPRRVDAFTTPTMQDDCMALLKLHHYLILDFSQTDFLTSAGLAMLVQLHRMAEESGGEVRLANCQPDVARVLDMVRFDQVLHIYSDVAAAAG